MNHQAAEEELGEERSVAPAVPLAFIHSESATWRKFEGDMPHLMRHLHPGHFRDGRDHVIAQPYLYLRGAGHDVCLTDALCSYAINIMHVDDLINYNEAWAHFVVVVQNDRPPPFVGNLCLVPRAGLVRRTDQHYIPAFVQHGLIPRDGDRGREIRRIGYIGSPRNLVPELQTNAFTEALKRRGVELVIKSSRWHWHDYSDLDLIVAMRPGAAMGYEYKPPTKLINAWASGTPALLYPEPGYEELRTGGDDYIEVRSVEDVLAAIDQLRQDPARYVRMLERCRCRAAEFSPDASIRRWLAFNRDTLQPAYGQWQGRRKAPSLWSTCLFRIRRRCYWQVRKRYVTKSWQ